MRNCLTHILSHTDTLTILLKAADLWYFSVSKIKWIQDFVYMNPKKPAHTKLSTSSLLCFWSHSDPPRLFPPLPVINTSSSEYRTSKAETPWSRPLTHPEINVPLRLEAAGLKRRHCELVTDTLRRSDRQPRQTPDTRLLNWQRCKYLWFSAETRWRMATGSKWENI